MDRYQFLVILGVYDKVGYYSEKAVGGPIGINGLRKSMVVATKVKINRGIDNFFKTVFIMPQ